MSVGREGLRFKGPLLGDAPGQHLVDPAPVHVDHLETPSQRLNGLARIGEVLELAGHRTGHGLTVPPLRQRDPELPGGPG
jgi:hypothetical protein